MTKQNKSNEAAAKLYRLAQAAALLRLYRKGRLNDRRSRHPSLGSLKPIKPTREDFELVEREHPKLVALARRNNS